MESVNKKVLIVMRGGVVQSIYASDENIVVDIFDFDEEDKDKNMANKKFEQESKDLLPIY